MDRVEEKRLLLAAQRGDEDAFTLLYRAHVQKIFRYVYYRVNDKHLAEDLTADVFMKALEGLPSYTDQGKPFLSWLYRIAHARVVDQYRRAGRRPAESDVTEAQVSVNPSMDQSIMRRQLAATLRDAIADLTADQQQVIILRFVEGQRLEEVAQVMGKNANAIKALQHRALRSLGNRLERSGFNVDEVLSGLS